MAKRLPAKCYQLKVTLIGTRPPIWRRLVVPGDLRLDELHEVIQMAMPWTDSHLHQFILKTEKPAEEEVVRRLRAGDWFSAGWRDGLRYLSHPNFEMDEVEDETSYRLDQIAPEPRIKFVYEYDFGDSWNHQIVVEKITASDPGTTCHPHCTDGALACPPDDCGGIPGFYRMLDILEDPGDDEHDDMLDWLGGEFDPEDFNADEVNRQLAKLRFGGKRRRRR